MEEIAHELERNLQQNRDRCYSVELVGSSRGSPAQRAKRHLRAVKYLKSDEWDAHIPVDTLYKTPLKFSTPDTPKLYCAVAIPLKSPSVSMISTELPSPMVQVSSEGWLKYNDLPRAFPLDTSCSPS